ncbi:MAG TPA: MarR family transcriptional regulator [Caulobacterales bacterium]|nr:MarR family transcriptional regulator [Caulobacterales bacterium]
MSSQPSAVSARSAPEHVDLGPLAGQVGYHLRLANAAAIKSFNDALGPLGLTPADYGALVVIERNPGLIQQDLAAALGLQRANLVRVLNQLETRGLIRRGGESRRENALFLTASGKKQMPAVHAAHAVHEQRIAQALRRELKPLLACLRDLAALDAG